MSIPKLALLNGFFVFVPENWLVIYYEHIVTAVDYKFLELIFASLALYMMKYSIC